MKNTQLTWIVKSVLKNLIVYILMAAILAGVFILASMILILERYDYVFLALTLGIIYITFIACFECRKAYPKIEMEFHNHEKTELYIEACKTLNTWQIGSTCWQIAEYASVVMSFLCTGLVVYIEAMDLQDAGKVIIYSFLSLAFMMFQYAVSPKTHAIQYRKAFIGLKKAIIKYQQEKEKIDIIIDAIDAGEKEISVCVAR